MVGLVAAVRISSRRHFEGMGIALYHLYQTAARRRRSVCAALLTRSRSADILGIFA